MSYYQNTTRDRHKSSGTMSGKASEESLCIFCFKNDRTSKGPSRKTGGSGSGRNRSENEENIVVVRRFFTMVQRYFEEKTGSEDSRGRRERSKLIEYLPVPNDLEVACCADCFEVVSSYCDVYHEMKVLELELDKKLEKLKKIMSCADDDGGRVGMRKSGAKKSGGKLGKSMEFRQLFQKYCELGSLDLFPKIKLERQEGHKRNSNSGMERTEFQDCAILLPSVAAETPTKRIKFSPPASPIHNDNYDDEWMASPEFDVKVHHLCEQIDDSVDSDWAAENLSNHSGGNTIEDGNFVVDVTGVSSAPINIEENFHFFEMHNNIEDGDYECRKCPTKPTFVSADKLQVHQNYLHTNGYVTLTKSDNTEVLRLNETDLILIGVDASIRRCSENFPDCTQQFILEKELQTHQKYHEEMTCDACGLTLNFAVDMAHHELDHLKNVDFVEDGIITCRKCEGYTTSLESQFINHYLKQHLDKPIVQATCPICQQKFKYVEKVPFLHYLNFHDLNRLEDPSSSRTQCGHQGCSAYFLTDDQLQVHWKSAHNELSKYDVPGLLEERKLNRREKNLHSSRKHRMNKPEEFNHKCEYCTKKFKTERSRNIHVWSFHADFKLGKPSGELQLTEDGLTIDDLFAEEDCACDICGKAMTNQNQLYIHRKHHGQFKCKFCDVVKYLAPELAIHETVHNKNFVSDNGNTSAAATEGFTCPRCSFKAKNRLDYIDHHLEAHLGLSADRKKCPICRKSVPRLVKCKAEGQKNWMVCHFMENHDMTGIDADKMRKCTNCSAYFRGPIQMINHMKEIHGEKNPNKCLDCGLTFTQSGNLRLHRAGIHNVDPSTFQFPCNLPECGSSFERQIELDYHQAWAHNEKDLGIKSCPECGRTFTGTPALASHMRVHQKKKNGMECICPFCSKKFRDNDRLSRHIRTHTLEKPFICQLCGQEFQEPYMLKNHVKKNHKQSSCVVRKRLVVNNDEVARKKMKLQLASQASSFNEDVDHGQWTSGGGGDGVPVVPGSNRKKRKRPLSKNSEKCKYCRKQFRKKGQLRTHIWSRHADQIVGKPSGQIQLTEDGMTIDEFIQENDCICDICEKPMPSERQLECHKLHHGEFQCNFCEFATTLATELAFHETIHYVPPKKKRINAATLDGNVNCARCSFTTATKNELDYIDHHLEAHQGLPSDRKKCPICSKPFPILPKIGNSQKNWMVMHYMDHHDQTELDPESTPKCDKCPAYFRTRVQLHNHSRDVHGDKSIHTCWDCGLFVDKIRKLRVHRIGVHNVDVSTFQYFCTFPDCGRSFERQIELDYHESLAHLEKDMGIQICPECGKKLTGTSPFLSHLKFHEREAERAAAEELMKNETHICEHCGKKYGTVKQLKEHVKIHVGRYTCQVCFKTCPTNYKLVRHMRVHTKEKPFECEFCGTAFSDKGTLGKHIKVLHKDKVNNSPN